MQIGKLNIKFWISSFVFIILALSGTYSTISIVTIHKLGNMTERLYKNNLNYTVFEIEKKFVSISYQTKDALSSKDTKILESNINLINTDKEIIESNLEIIKEKYSGTKDILDNVINNYNTMSKAIDSALNSKKNGVFPDDIKDIFISFSDSIKKFKDVIDKDNQQYYERTKSRNFWSLTFMYSILFISLILIGVLPFVLHRSFAVNMNQTSKELQTYAEILQEAAQQQLTSTTEQATATTQITSTMDELVAASKQIAKRAKDVVDSAEMANGSSVEGLRTLETAVEGMERIKDQVKNILNNMLQLGEKTQQMGIALEILNELTEQTTILSYNAAIEAAGAGESGRRFSAVAEQIMKLANKAVESTKDIKTMIEDVQKSSNTTVLATEDGMKAVDEGNRHIQNSRQNFDKILKSTEDNLTAVKEIEITISQQTIAIEQTSLGVKDIQISAENINNVSNQVLSTAKTIHDMAKK
ncbi:MAG: hypothetical protein HQK76_14825 [Desulfobacterales bacterium]|nr:hypothetical protein [Desulfobacterales bacterium]